MYLQSDFLITKNDFQALKTDLFTLNNESGIPDYSQIITGFDSLNEKAISNAEYINKAQLYDTDIGQRLLFYYDDIEYLIDRLKPKAEFFFYVLKIQNIGDVLSVNISNSDNYEFIPDWIRDSINQIGTLHDQYKNSHALQNDLELKILLEQYFSEILNYYEVLVPIVETIPDYISKNDRDQTRIVLQQIQDMSAQYTANENNLSSLADQYFSNYYQSVDATINRLEAENTNIILAFISL